MNATRVVLIRHAHSVAGAGVAFDCSVPGPPLTEFGREQATGLATAFDARTRSISRIVSSTMRRARQTAEPLAVRRGLPIMVDAGLREVDKGDLHLRTGPDAVIDGDRLTEAWTAGRLGIRRPGGESATEAIGRFRAGVIRIARSADCPGGGPDRGGGSADVVILTHAGLLRLAIQHLLSWPATGPDRPVGSVAVPNLACLEVDVTDEGLVVVDWRPAGLGHSGRNAPPLAQAAFSRGTAEFSKPSAPGADHAGSRYPHPPVSRATLTHQQKG